MSRDQDIAHRYRLDNSKTVYWDKEDSAQQMKCSKIAVKCGRSNKQNLQLDFK